MTYIHTANICSFTLFKINFTYINQEIHCFIFQKYVIYFITSSSSVQIIHTFFITHTLKYKHQPSHLNVNKTSRWTPFWVSYTFIIHSKCFYKDHDDNYDKVMNSVTYFRVAHAGITTVLSISWKYLSIKCNTPNTFLHQPAT
jgi:hypothetical protein